MKLKTEEFRYTDADGVAAKLPVVFEVSSDGIFHAIIPEWLVDGVKGLSALQLEGVACGKAVVNFRLSCKIKDRIGRVINEALRVYSAPEVSTVRVIRYWWLSKVSAFADKETGEPYPNGMVFSQATGHDVGFNRDHGDWVKMRDDSSANSPHTGFSIGVYGCVMDKITTTRGNSSKTTYELPRGMDESLSNPAYMLNSWAGVRLPNDGRVEEMPYTEEAATFFHNTMKSMARIGIMLNDFFIDKQALQLAITQGRGPLMLGAPQIAKADAE